jgi:hypothetical protein
MFAPTIRFATALVEGRFLVLTDGPKRPKVVL